MKITVMAELHVQPKRNNSLWLWLVIIVVILFIAGLLIYNRYNHPEPVNSKRTSQLQKDFSFTKTLNYV
jgi:uncharacterized membrane protein